MIRAENTTVTGEWLIPLVFNQIFLLSVIWIFVSLVYYGIKAKKWKSDKPRKQSDKLNEGLIYSSVVLSVFLCLFLYVVHGASIILNVTSPKNETCETLFDAEVNLLALNDFSIYLFMWLRQKIFFSNPVLKTIYSRAVKIVSMLSIILLAFPLLAAIVGTIPVQTYSNLKSVCLPLNVNSDIRAISLIVGITFLVLAQLLLLYLFLYALRPAKLTITSDLSKKSKGTSKFVEEVSQLRSSTSNVSSHANRAAETKPSTTEETENRESLQPNQNRRHPSSKTRRILRKTLFTAISSIITDTICWILYYTLDNDYRLYLALIISGNELLKLLLVIFSFSQWKDMLLSPCREINIQRYVC